MRLGKRFWRPLLAVLLALVAANYWQVQPLGQRLSALGVDALLRQAPELRQEAPAVLTVVASYRYDSLLLLQARSALLQTPVLARKLLPLYGREALFQQLLRRWGSEALLPIAYFYDHQIATLVARRYVGHHYQQVKRYLKQQMDSWLGEADNLPTRRVVPLDRPATAPQTDAFQALTPLARGGYAMGLIERDNLRFMSQFKWQPGGRVLWLQSQRAIEDVGNFLAGGIRRVEVKVRTDRPLTGADLGLALVDIAALAWPVLKTADVLRGSALAGSGRLAASSKLGARGAARGELGMVKGESRWGKLAHAGGRVAQLGGRSIGQLWRYRLLVGVGVIWVAVMQPGIVSDLLARIAELWGLPTLPVVVAGWFLLLLPLLYVLSWLGRLLLLLMRLRRSAP